MQASSFQPELTIEQIVGLYAGLYSLRITRQDIAERIRDIRLGDELGKTFKSLSGGHQQRLSLLIAVIHQPVLLLLDEPTSGLDLQSRRQFVGPAVPDDLHTVTPRLIVHDGSHAIEFYFSLTANET